MLKQLPVKEIKRKLLINFSIGNLDSIVMGVESFVQQSHGMGEGIQLTSSEEHLP